MIRRAALWMITAGLFVLAALPDAVVGQSATPPDPTQYPALANNSHFQESDWMFRQRAYPLGYIPPGARDQALQKIELSKASNPAATTDVWTSIGPAPVTGSGQIPGFRAASGRVASVAVDPANAAHWLLGAAQGGIWETTDAGSPWNSRTDNQPSLAMGAIAFARSNRTTAFAGDR